MTIFKSYSEKREKKNYLIFDSLKLQLADCPNLEFNQYILKFVKTFIKCGRLEKVQRYGIYTLFIHNRDYESYIMIENNNGNKEITISISSILKNASQNMTKKVVFDKDSIIMLDKVKYEDSKEASLESTSCSMFKNNCPINALGDNNLTFLETKEISLENGEKKECTELIRIRNNGLALGEMWNSEEQKKLYFKDKNIFITFEDFLINGFTALEQAELSDEIIDEDNKFVKKWLKENYEPKEKKSVPNKKLS